MSFVVYHKHNLSKTIVNPDFSTEGLMLKTAKCIKINSALRLGGTFVLVGARAPPFRPLVTGDSQQGVYFCSFVSRSVVY